MIGRVAIQDSGARLKPTRPLIAMKVTLLVRKSPWQMASSQRFRFMGVGGGAQESSLYSRCKWVARYRHNYLLPRTPLAFTTPAKMVILCVTSQSPAATQRIEHAHSHT